MALSLSTTQLYRAPQLPRDRLLDLAPEKRLIRAGDARIQTPGGYRIDLGESGAWMITAPDGVQTRIPGDGPVRRSATFLLGDGTTIDVDPVSRQLNIATGWGTGDGSWVTVYGLGSGTAYVGPVQYRSWVNRRPQPAPARAPYVVPPIVQSRPQPYAVSHVIGLVSNWLRGLRR